MDNQLPQARALALRALRKFGALHQINKTQEELFELNIELGKHKINGTSKEAIIDEIVDVWLTTIQMAVLFGWDECTERLIFKMEKLSRLVNDSDRRPEHSYPFPF